MSTLPDSDKPKIEQMGLGEYQRRKDDRLGLRDICEGGSYALAFLIEDAVFRDALIAQVVVTDLDYSKQDRLGLKSFWRNSEGRTVTTSIAGFVLSLDKLWYPQEDYSPSITVNFSPRKAKRVIPITEGYILEPSDDSEELRRVFEAVDAERELVGV